MDRADDAVPRDSVPLAELLEERRHLLDVARWMLGGGSEAEHAVDEAYRKWYALSRPARARIAEPRSWLVRTTGSICLDRPAPPGHAAPGHHSAPDTPTPAQRPRAVLAEEIDEVLLGALGSLTPAERAAFVLNGVFGMPPGTVSGTVGRSEHEWTEPVHRARHSLRTRRARPATPRRHDTVVRAVRRACVTRNPVLLASLLAPDATAYFDGGGKVRALDRPVRGARHVARSLLTLLAGTTLQTRSVNGRTGLVVRHHQQVAAVICLDIAGHRAARIWIILNPDKLRSWNRRGPSSPPPPAG
ncbi:RNA polymerase subunit sigma [Streptomyces sp. NPDC007883]|uniref:RNA polymerase subunit sigma n=1 Tax=Streptomyces sp. NPDC007883 TaxID=3155116 RepID=UPI0033D959BD